tara:strand:+ start:2671 stop:3477 length:807 start_codon:yes stop_codon:yes gene_type:complete
LKPKSKILIIAGSDSSGGAGIQADIKTVTSLGSYAMTAITALTSQNTNGVKSIVPVNNNEIAKQIEFTCKDIRPDAIKIGMLQNEIAAKSVLKSIKRIKVKKIILDPVMVSTSGVKLINKKSIDFIKNNLIKHVTLITPNIPEAEILSGMKINNYKDMIKASKIIIDLGAKSILLKGGHLNSKDIFDIFADKKKIKIFKNIKYRSKNTHGTGCTLSTAIATFYSCGKDLNKSCDLAIKYVNSAIRTAPNYGKGNGPINHLVNIRSYKL